MSEGSTLGAAFLLKAVEAIGLGEDCGARHLAAAPEGRGRHWRDFKEALNSVPLTPAEDDLVVGGARAAFTHVHGLVAAVMGPGRKVPAKFQCADSKSSDPPGPLVTPIN